MGDAFSINHTEFRFSGAGGLSLFGQGWLPDGDPRAVIILVHGLGEHCGRYDNLIGRLVPLGYAIYGFDHRGHGRSPGQRAHVDDFAEYREDVHRFRQWVAGQMPAQPLFVYGHSMGGLIALDYVLHHRQGVRGVIASAPALRADTTSPVLVALVRLLSRIWPRASLSTGLDQSGLSRDPQVIEAYASDPLVHSKASARWGTEMMATMDQTLKSADRLALPILIIHGSADRLTSPEASQHFFDNVSFPDKAYISYEGGYHEPHNDLQQGQVLDDISQWLAQHLETGGQTLEDKG